MPGSAPLFGNPGLVHPMSCKEAATFHLLTHIQAQQVHHILKLPISSSSGFHKVLSDIGQPH